jgi:hypothetical protein
MVSKWLDAQIHDPIERTYLDAIDGYWADLVVAEFGFLEERGGQLDAVSFHQKGDFARYNGPWGEVVLHFMPDNYPGGRWIAAEARLHGAAAEFDGDLDRLVRQRRPGSPLPPSAPLDEATVAANVRAWADVLRSATDLF